MLNRPQNIFQFVYSTAYRLGFLHYPWVRALYHWAYFRYKQFYENGFVKLIRTHRAWFADGDIIDVGANIGFTAWLFSSGLSPGFHVVAFEPEETNYSALERMRVQYRLTEKIIAYRKAVGAGEGKLNLWVNYDDAADHRILTTVFEQHVGEEREVQSVEVVSLDDALGDRPVSFIKIDVQGYEIPVCLGMVETLRRNPHASIAIEYCPSIMKALGYDPLDLLGFFKEREYRMYQLDRSKGLVAVQAGDIQHYHGEGYFDLLFTKRMQ